MITEADLHFEKKMSWVNEEQGTGRFANGNPTRTNLYYDKKYDIQKQVTVPVRPVANEPVKEKINYYLGLNYKAYPKLEDALKVINKRIESEKKRKEAPQLRRDRALAYHYKKKAEKEDKIK